MYYYNMDMQDLDVAAGFPVAKALPGWGEILFDEISASDHALCLYTGPYEDCVPAYEALGSFIETRQREPVGVVYKHSLNSSEEDSPAELQTWIDFPLKP